MISPIKAAIHPRHTLFYACKLRYIFQSDLITAIDKRYHLIQFWRQKAFPENLRKFKDENLPFGTRSM